MTVKTAISLDQELFERVESLARELKLPRSRVVALALEAFIRRRENQKLLDQINAALEGDDQAEERDLTRAMRPHHRRVIESDW